MVGVISDTHGLVRPQALGALAGADLIVHASDVGAPHVLDALAEIAPVTHMEEREGVLCFNPGSAGPRRFELPVCVGRLTVRGTG